MKNLIKTLKTKITKTLLALVLTLCLVTGTASAYTQYFAGHTSYAVGLDQYCEVNHEGFSVVSGSSSSSSCGYKQEILMTVSRFYGNPYLWVNGDLRAEQLCDESGENCKDISEGWEAEVAQSAIEWSEILNIPENITNQNFEKIDGNDKLTMSNHTGKFTITTLDNAYWEGLPLNMGATPFIFSIGQMVNRELGITLRNFDKEKVAYFSPNGNLEIAGDIKADGKICDGNDKCIGDSAPTTPEVPKGTLCGFCENRTTTIPCGESKNICIENGCPAGWDLTVLFGNKKSCVKQ